MSSYELWSAGMLAFGDLTAYPNDAGAFVDAFRSAWSERGLGGPFSTGPGALITALLVAVVGPNAELAQYIYLAAWIPIAFAGMVYLCRRWLRVGWGVAVAGGVLYATTPVAIGLVVAGAGGLLWSYALVPFVIATAEKVRIEGFRAVGWFAAALALLSAFSAELLIFGFLIATIWVVVGPGRRRILPAISVALAVATIAALPGIFARGEIRPSDRLVDKALADFSFTYDEASLLRLVRLAGNQGDPMDHLGYNEAAAWTLVGFAPCLLLVGGLLRRRRGDALQLRLSVLASAALAALLGVAFAAERRADLFERLPPLLAFRNPEKLMIPLAAGLVTGAMYGVERGLERAGKRRRLLEFAALAGLGLYLLFYAQPAFSGHWGIKSVRGDAYVADDELLAAARFLQRTDPSLPGNWRVAWVPFSSADVLSLEWVLPQWANDPVLENRDPEIEDASGVLEESLKEADMRSFHSVADRAAVRYIVLRKNAEPETARAIRDDRKLERIHRGRGFEVWRNAAALPRIRSFSGLTAVVAQRRPHPVEFKSRPIARLNPDVLAPRSGWTVHPREDFAWAGEAIRIRATHSAYWPVLARRIPVHAETSYAITAQVRTRNAAGAHLKVVWYRGRDDLEREALEHDYAAPTLTGDHGWKRISGIVESPPGARFGELMFLAGKRPVKSRKAAVSWVRDLRIANYYSGDPAPRGAQVLAAIPETRRNHELAEAASLESTLAGRVPDRLPLDVAVVNPTFQGSRSRAFRNLLRRASRIAIAAQAEVALQPRRGVWRHIVDSVELASSRGEASIPLGLVESGHYFVSVIGCRLPSRSLRIEVPLRTLRPLLSGPLSGCGRMRTMGPVALEGRATVHFALPRGASIASVQATPVAFRQPAANVGAGEVRITAANTPSPTVRGLSSGGLTLADAFHPDWRTSGSGAAHFRTALGFNGFLVDDPHALSGLSYGPQRTRDLLLALSVVGWLAIAAMLFLGSRARLRARLTGRDPQSAAQVPKRVGNTL